VIGLTNASRAARAVVRLAICHFDYVIVRAHV